MYKPDTFKNMFKPDSKVYAMIPPVKEEPAQTQAPTVLFGMGDLSIKQDGQKQWTPNRFLLSDLPFGGIATKASAKTPEELIASNPKVLNICHPNWHGIRQATWGQGYDVLEVPGILSSNHQKSLINFLTYLPSLQVVMINGIPPLTVQFATALREALPQLQIMFIYHGSLSQPFHEAEATPVNDMIEAALKGVVNKIGVVKNGMVESFRAMGVKSEEIWNFPEAPYGLRPLKSVDNLDKMVLPSMRIEKSNYKWNVGVFGSLWVHKNLFVQVFALCKIPNVVIHVLSKPKLAYLDHCEAEIVAHGDFLEHGQFMKLVRSMDLTLYISLTECFPMTVIESINVGIPALTSATSSIYSLDPTLEKFLVVPGLDSPDYIAEAVVNVMRNYRDIQIRLWQLMPYIDMKAQRQMALLLSSSGNTLPEIPMIDQVPVFQGLPKQSTNQLRTICIVSDSLYPKSFTEQSLATHGEALQMLKQGHSVLHLVTGPKVQAQIDHPNYSVYFIDDLLQLPKNKDSQMSQSLKLAKALKVLYGQVPFDMVEIPDTAGLAYELLHTPGSSYPIFDKARSLPVRTHGKNHDFLPDSVAIVLRVYGTKQIHDQESTATWSASDISSDQMRMYLQEQYCILTADVVLVGTKRDSATLEMIYGIQKTELELQPLQLGYIRDSITKVLEQDSSSWYGSSVIVIWDPFATEASMIDTFWYFSDFLQEGTIIQSNPSLIVVFILPVDMPEDSEFFKAYNNLPVRYKKYFELQQHQDLDTMTWLSMSVRAFFRPPYTVVGHDYWQDITSWMRVPIITHQKLDKAFQYTQGNFASFKKTVTEVLLEDDSQRSFTLQPSLLLQTRNGQGRYAAADQNELVYGRFDLQSSQPKRRYNNMRAEWVKKFIVKIEMDLMLHEEY